MNVPNGPPWGPPFPMGKGADWGCLPAGRVFGVDFEKTSESRRGRFLVLFGGFGLWDQCEKKRGAAGQNGGTLALKRAVCLRPTSGRKPWESKILKWVCERVCSRNWKGRPLGWKIADHNESYQKRARLGCGVVLWKNW